MDSEQQIRAAAAQAAASMVPRGAPISDYVSVCDVVAAFIENGWEAAHAAYLRYDKNVAPPEGAPPQPTGPQPAMLTEPLTSPAIASQRTEPTSEAIPAEVNKPVPPKQQAARKIVDETIKARARKIANVASVAKARAHLEDLKVEADDAGLLEVLITTPGDRSKAMTLKAYLESLTKS